MGSLSRRRLLSATAVAGSALMFRHALGNPLATDDFREHIAALERAHGGRLGVSILDMPSGRSLEYRGAGRFPICSTFKWILVALVLTRVDAGKEALDRRIAISKDDLVSYSPISGQHVGDAGMSVAELCHAAITVSDNTAANVLLASCGGPAALTEFARKCGDSVTRLDRLEPDLNEGTPGDPRDTTSPIAMTGIMQTLLLDNVLKASSRVQLTQWLVANTTGDTRLRAGLPKTWRIGDKTGSSSAGISNDIAIAWPPNRGPVLIAVYYAESKADGAARGAVIAEVGRIAATLVAKVSKRRPTA
ncbi:MAG: class A beta-lactamase [Dokdonella sp.]